MRKKWTTPEGLLTKSLGRKPLFKDLPTSSPILLLALCVAVVLPLPACGGTSGKPGEQAALEIGPGNHERTIQVGGRERSYSLHIPPSYSKSRPMPVVLNLHGGGGTPETQRNISEMDETADRKGFVVVYPQGTNRKGKLIPGYTWNAGTCCGWAEENGIDDVAFMEALLSDLERVVSIDQKRIYATGISNGAMMAYRLACELAHRIAAVAPVSGPMQVKDCRPSRPVSIMHFHGTEDPFVPFGGGKGPRSLPGQSFTPVEETLGFWIEFNGLDPRSPDISRTGNAVRYDYGTGKTGAEVVLWKIEGGGHTWPGGTFGFLKEGMLGKMTMDISASNVMWDFFSGHSLP